MLLQSEIPMTEPCNLTDAKSSAKRRYSKATVIRELLSEIDSYRRSYVETDGVIRDRSALKTITCLEQAVEAVYAYQPKPAEQKA